MPQPYSSPPPGKRSASAPPSPAKNRSSGIFTALPPDSSPSEADSPGNPALSESDQLFPPDGSLDATEPFPDDLFRVPIPDEVFGEMPERSDSALQAHLALIRLSFRFDPEESSWVKPDRTFTRADVQQPSGLSSQGVRNGLRELAEAGWVQVDESGRSYEYALEMRVPTSRYTYVPTALLEAASALSGTELRLVLAVIRATWGWTFPADEGEEQPSHRRWARLSTGELARRTGRSETAVKEAASNLQGRYLERLRPTDGAYHYRFLPEAIMPDEGPAGARSEETLEETSGLDSIRVEKKIRAFVSVGTSNDLAPDRQKSDPPNTLESNLFREAKQRGRPEKKGSSREKPRPSGEGAVPGESTPPESKTDRPPARGKRSRQQRGPSTTSPNKAPVETGQTSPDEEKSQALAQFDDQLQALGQALASAGVRPKCIPRLLTRFSAERIEANLQLYRHRAASVERPGAWLYSAVTQGYALPSSGKGPFPENASSTQSRPPGKQDDVLPEPGTKVSETRKRELIRAGRATEEDFDKFADYDDPDRKQHFYRLE